MFLGDFVDVLLLLLLFSGVWSAEGFNKKDFLSIIKAALEVASCQLSLENCERNKRMRKSLALAAAAAAAGAEEYFESDLEEERGRREIKFVQL